MRDWELTPAGLLPLSTNWVSRVHRADGSAAVLKLGFPEAGHIADEATALQWFGGRGAVEVLARDDARGALLLEEVRPGSPVRTLVPDRDEEATAALIGVMKRLHRPAPVGADGPALPELAGRSASFADHLHRFPGDGPIPRRLVERAAVLFDDLCATAAQRVVLHGDLHHDNVLSAGVGREPAGEDSARTEQEPWLAIDPHGVVGDPGYEVGALLYNPDPDGTDDTVLSLAESRIEQLADGLGMPADRVVAWGFVQGVLSEVWSFQGDATVNTRALRLAERLLPMLL